MILSKEMKVSDIVNDNPRLILMLEHLDIPLGLQDKSIEQVCRDNKINSQVFLTIGNLYNGHPPDKNFLFLQDEMKTILTYLEKNHKHYLEEQFPLMTSLIGEIVKVNIHPEIALLEQFFNDYYKEVIEHLNYENQIVFPYVTMLQSQISHGNDISGNSKYSIAEYQGHHDDIEEKLADLRNLLIKYLPSHNDTPFRRRLLFTLSELEFDLHIHSKIEESILVPMVEYMEQMLKLN